MKVRCIEDSFHKGVTKGKIYKVIKIVDRGHVKFYDIRDDNGIIDRLISSRFVPVEETPNQAKINNLKDTANRALCFERVESGKININGDWIKVYENDTVEDIEYRINNHVMDAHVYVHESIPIDVTVDTIEIPSLTESLKDLHKQYPSDEWRKSFQEKMEKEISEHKNHKKQHGKASIIWGSREV
jgi:hypothetical protein